MSTTTPASALKRNEGKNNECATPFSVVFADAGTVGTMMLGGGLCMDVTSRVSSKST
jgi:hypothetical protein